MKYIAISRDQIWLDSVESAIIRHVNGGSGNELSDELTAIFSHSMSNNVLITLSSNSKEWEKATQLIQSNGLSSCILISVATQSFDTNSSVLPSLTEIGSVLLALGQDHRVGSHGSNELSCLTDREVEIVSLTCRGLSIRKIAEHLHRAPSTIARHRANIMKKLDIHDIVALTHIAIRSGLVEP